MKKFMLLCSAPAIMFAAMPVQAQEADKAPPKPEAVASATIQDIVVTAERRSNTVQKSSLSIEVFSGTQLSRVVNVQDLTTLSPGVQVGSSGTQPQVYIRGVGDVAPNSRTQSAVAFNIDGIYYARGIQVTPSMFDIERVEVLKGPQGTLYGRNASGGAINVITRRPTLGKLEGFVAGALTNFNGKEVSAAVNIPIGQQLALRVSGQIIDRDGYLSDGGLDQKNKAVRGRLLWQPSERFSVLFNADYLHVGGIGSGRVVTPSPNGNPWRGTVEAPYAFPFLLSATTTPPLTAPTDRFNDANIYGFSAEVNADLGFATLTVIPAYRYQDSATATYTSNFRVYEGLRDKQSSLEARLGADRGPLKWVLGGYLFRESQAVELDPSQNNRSAVQFNTTVKAAAAFAQATYSLTHAFRLIGGARYTHEVTDGNYVQGTALMPYLSFTANSPVVQVNPLTANAFNYKLGAEYDFARRSMLFATFATGFKGGGFSQTLACGADKYDPEKLYAATLGMRNRFMDNRLQVNAEAFHWKYKNQQISFTGVDNCGGITQLIRNAGDATIQGANIDVMFKLSANDTLRGSVEFNDARYDNYKLIQFGIGQFGPTSGTLCTPTVQADPRFYAINCTGQQLARTPKWAGTIGYERTLPLKNGGNFKFGADAQFATDRWLENSYLPNGHAGGYSVYNAQLTYNTPTGNISITAFMNNITNEAVYTSGTQISALAPNGYRYYTATIQPPRFFGVRGKVNF